MKIPLGDHTKGADGCQRAALDAVDRVDAIALAHWSPITSAREIEISREHIMPLLFSVPLACTAPTAEASVPRITTVPADVRSWIVSVEHDSLSQGCGARDQRLRNPSPLRTVYVK